MVLTLFGLILGSLEMLEKLLKWLLFSAIVSVVPLFSTYIILIIYSSKPSFVSIISRGELQLISVALLANGIGEVVTSGSIRKVFQILLAGVSTVFLLIISIWYGAITSLLISGNPTGSYQSLEYPTLIAFLVSFFISACCVAVGDTEK
jgi:hypothetical protein